MLDLELVEDTTAAATDVVSLVEFKRHMRMPISDGPLDEDLVASIEAAVDTIDGYGGSLNRTVRPRMWCRYLPGFPRSGLIELPYPPLQSVVSVNYMSGADDPQQTIEPDAIIVRKDGMVGSIEFVGGVYWPTTYRHRRGVAITFIAGYETYPPMIKRLVKILAADFFENKEATILDRRISLVSRQIEYGVDFLHNQLRVPVAYDEWG